MNASESPWLREHFRNVDQERLPNNKKAICEDKCSTHKDGICDDGGPDSVFAECEYGFDCTVRSPEHPIPYTRGLLLIHARPCTHPAQDCCPRDPFWGWGDRYTGTLDAGLTRMVCMQETIIINATSPCLNDTEYRIESTVGDVDLTQLEATALVMVLLMLLCVAVFFILVPVAVYAQLVYSGLWPVLNWRQRIWCMLNGNFEAMDQVKQVEVKRSLRREKTIARLSQQGGGALPRCLRGVGWCKPEHRWFHMTHTIQRADGLYRTLSNICGAVRSLQWGCSSLPSSAKFGTCCCKVLRGTWCMLRTFLFSLCHLGRDLATWDVIFDIIPLSWDGQWARAFVKLLRLVTASFVLALLLTHIPKQNAAAVKETLRCVLASCKANFWRTTATALGCKATDAVGVTQPTFWSDLVDVVEASLSLAVLVLIAEWRDTVQGKNKIGKELLLKVDKELEQKHDADLVPLGEPGVKLYLSPGVKLYLSRQAKKAAAAKEKAAKEARAKADKAGTVEAKEAAEAAEKAAAAAEVVKAKKKASEASIPWKDCWKTRELPEDFIKSLQVLKSLRDEEAVETPEKQQADRVAAVNLGAPGAKISMAQLYAALGSIAAIVADARSYDSQCVSNALLWVNPDGIRPDGPAAGTYTDSEQLELWLMKPSRQPFLSWVSILRATMTNLTLVTIGVAVKNFLTRTAGAKAAVKAMKQQEDKNPEDNSVLHILLSVMRNVKQTTVLILLSVKRKVMHMWSFIKRKCCPPKAEVKKGASEEKGPGPSDTKKKLKTSDDEASKQNAQSIDKIYLISSFALLLIAGWYSFCLLAACFYVPWLQFAQTLVLLITVFLTLVPLLDFIADTLGRGMDGDDRRKTDAAIFVVKAVIFLRACLIMSQGAMLRHLYKYYRSEPMTWDSYWRSGDAFEKLMYIFTLDLPNIFNFQINIVSKLLSFVVLGLELVNLIGSNMVGTATFRLLPGKVFWCCCCFCNCCCNCQRSFVRLMACFSRLGTAVSFAKAAQETAENVEEGLDGEGLELEALLEPESLIKVQEHVQSALEAARPLLYDRLQKEICRKPDGALVKLNKKLQNKKMPQIKWEHVQAVLERVDTLEKLQATAGRALHDPEAFLQGLASGAMPEAKQLMLSRLKRSLESHLDEKDVETILQQLETLTTMQALQDALKAAERESDPELFKDLLQDGPEAQALLDGLQTGVEKNAPQTRAKSLDPQADEGSTTASNVIGPSGSGSASARMVANDWLQSTVASVTEQDSDSLHRASSLVSGQL